MFQTIYKLDTVLEFSCDPNIDTGFMETSPWAQGKPAFAESFYLMGGTLTLTMRLLHINLFNIPEPKNKLKTEDRLLGCCMFV